MKVLVIGPDYFNYTSSVAWGLWENGHETEIFAYQGFSEGSSYLVRKFHKLGWQSWERDYYKEWNRKLREKYHFFQPDACLVLNGDHISRENLREWQSAGTRKILWLMDSILRMPHYEELLSLYDSIYSFEPGDKDYIRENWGLVCQYCPMGYDPRVYHPAETKERDIDISFVGAATANRVDLLHKVAEYAAANGRSMAVHGGFWDQRYFWKAGRFRQKHSALYPFVHNGNLPPEQVADVYQRSKICLNIHIPEHAGLNPRTFEILATRSCQMVDEREGLTDFLSPEKEIIMYQSPEDLLEKLDMMLKDEQLREDFARRGYRRINEKYSVVNLVAKLVYGR